jgi:hypothetical protein
MTAQIRPNRMEVTDRFPMLGFSVRVDEPNVEAEVVLANDISLFDSKNKGKRQANNFYTSRESGTLMVPRGEGVFVVAPEVLERFVGSEKLFFGLATGHSGNGGLQVDALPREGSPYISLRSFTGRTLRRNFRKSRQVTTTRLDWAGDAPRPGSESAPPAAASAPAAGAAPAAAPAPSKRNGGNGAGQPAPISTPRSGEYDDGFGPMPAIPARETAYRGAVTKRSPTPRTLSSGTSAREALDWIMHKVEQGVAAAGSDVSPPAIYRLGGNSSTFIKVWETVFGASINPISIVSPIIGAVLSPGGNGFLAALPSLAKETGVTLSIGPALDTPLFGAGAGVVFAPDGQVGLFGAGDISVSFSGLSDFFSSLKAALQAKLKLGYNSGGIDGFASLRKVAALNVGEEIVVGAELWLDGSGKGIGGAASIGVGFALELAAEGDIDTASPVKMEPATSAPAPVGLTMSSGTTARDALNWIKSKVEQVVGAVGSDVNPPSLFRLGANSGTFITLWEDFFKVTGLFSGFNAFLAEVPGLARDSGLTLSIGPALDTPLFGGGVGAVFSPDGQAALFGGGDISLDLSSLKEFVSSLKLALQVKMKLGYNGGGIDGFANLGKVAAVNAGEEVVVGAEIWLDRSGNGIGGAVSIGAGFALELAAGAEPPLPTPRSARRGPPAAAMVVGLEDRQRARRYGRDFMDIFQWTVPDSVVKQLTARDMSVQTIDAAVGDLNLDFYKVDITQWPSGWDPQKFLWHFMRHINDFINTTYTEFEPYDDSDAARLASDNPVGTVFFLDMLGPDNASIVISQVTKQYFAVSTVHAPRSGDHPVSGHRMFGYANEKGKTVWFTRAADRPTLLPQGFQEAIFAGAEKLWESMQRGVASFINDNGGTATIVEPFSERFNPTAMREEFGHFDVAQALALDDATPSIVRPVLPNDQRARAARIGGPFAGRIGEALDIGLEPKSLDALLNTLDPPATAQPMSARRAPKRPTAKAQGLTRSINWDDVELIPQPTDQTCWAAAAAMVIGWRDQVSLTPETVASICARSTVAELSPFDRVTFAKQIGLQTEPPQSYSADGFYDLLANRGPLWVSKIAGGGATSGHAVVVTGMYSDGDQHYVRIADPWDRVVGTPGTPGGYATTHATGSRYIMRYEDFQTEYELRIVGDPPTPQILDAGGTGGRVPNTSTTSAPAGYAMADPPPRKPRPRSLPPTRSRQMDAGPMIGGTPVTQVTGGSAGVTWSLPQWAGVKHPNDKAPATEAVYRDGVIALDQWPRLSGPSGSDDVCAWFQVRWQYNGTSLGHIHVEPKGDDTARGGGLIVTGTIEDEPQLYPRSATAQVAGPDQVPALHVVMKYVFDAGVGAHVATRRVTLYADGTHQIDSAWTQQAAPAPAPSRDLVPA